MGLVMKFTRKPYLCFLVIDLTDSIYSELKVLNKQKGSLSSL